MKYLNEEDEENEVEIIPEEVEEDDEDEDYGEVDSDVPDDIRRNEVEEYDEREVLKLGDGAENFI